MATWTEVKQYVFQNYKVEQDNGQSLMVNLSGGGRSQLVFLMNINDLIVFNSPVAKVGEVPPGKVLTSAPLFGVVQSDDYYSLRHVVLLSTLDTAELDLAILEFGQAADSLEAELSGGGDQF